MCPLETMNFNKVCPFTHNIILHGSHSHNLYWIYALLSRLRALGGTFWPKFGGRRHKKHFKGPGVKHRGAIGGIGMDHAASEDLK